MAHLWDALCRAYDVLGFDEAGRCDELFRQLILARIIEPTSKQDSLRVLEEVGVQQVRPHPPLPHRPDPRRATDPHRRRPTPTRPTRPTRPDTPMQPVRHRRVTAQDCRRLAGRNSSRPTTPATPTTWQASAPPTHPHLHLRGSRRRRALRPTVSRRGARILRCLPLLPAGRRPPVNQLMVVADRRRSVSLRILA